MTQLEVLREEITESGLSAYAIAKQAGIAPNTVLSIMRGDGGNPTNGTMELIRIVLEASRAS